MGITARMRHGRHAIVWSLEGVGRIRWVHREVPNQNSSDGIANWDAWCAYPSGMARGMAHVPGGSAEAGTARAGVTPERVFRSVRRPMARVTYALTQITHPCHHVVRTAMHSAPQSIRTSCAH